MDQKSEKKLFWNSMNKWPQIVHVTMAYETTNYVWMDKFMRYNRFYSEPKPQKKKKKQVWFLRSNSPLGVHGVSGEKQLGLEHL